MHVPQNINYLAVLVTGIVVFLIGGLWYNVLFKSAWMALVKPGETAAMGANMAVFYVKMIVVSIVIAWGIAVILNHFVELDWMRGASVGVLCWLGFVATTSYAHGTAHATPTKLWVIEAGHNLVTFAVAGAILAVWR
jgi:hypothetical protein